MCKGIIYSYINCITNVKNTYSEKIATIDGVVVSKNF